MRKLLFDTEILLGAIQPESPAALLFDRCRKNPDDIQVWILADTIEQLIAAGVKHSDLAGLLTGISQIPVNALLNTKALESSEPFRKGLVTAVAQTFKIQYVVSDSLSGFDDAVTFISCDQALKMIENPAPVDRVDFMNLNLALHPVFNRVDGWFTDIIQNTAFAGGNHVTAFEQEFSRYCGTEYAIGVSNGTDALRFALLAMGIGIGDEVITVANTFIATSEVITQIGAKPVFVDVTEDTYTLDPELLAEKITDHTKAIIPVHLYGQVANMEQIKEIADRHGIFILEDACQAHGALYKGKRAGALGRAAAFSMYPGKNLGAFGEAGCIVTNDQQIDEIARCLREHGQSQKYYHRMEGYNGRMDNLQAASLRGKLPFLDSWNDKRRKLAKLYLENLAEMPQVVLPTVPDFAAHVFHLFVILVPDPAALSDFLKSKNIFTAFHYPVPLHRQQAYQGREQGLGNYPVSETCAQRLISLPMYPELTADQVLKVCAEIRHFYSR